MGRDFMDRWVDANCPPDAVGALGRHRLRLYYITFWIILPVTLIALVLVTLFDEANRSDNAVRAAVVGSLFLVAGLTPLWLVSPDHSYLDLVFRAATCRLSHCTSPWAVWRSNAQVRPINRQTGAKEKIEWRMRMAGTVWCTLFYLSTVRSLYSNGGFISTATNVLPITALGSMQLMDPKAAAVLGGVVYSVAAAVCLHATPDVAYEVAPATTRAVLLVLYPSMIIGLAWTYDRVWGLATRQQKEHAAAQANFISFMSHELRTPMQGLVGVRDILESTPTSKERKEAEELLNVAVQQAQALYAAMLDHAVVNTANDCPTDFSVADVVDELPPKVTVVNHCHKSTAVRCTRSLFVGAISRLARYGKLRSEKFGDEAKLSLGLGQPEDWDEVSNDSTVSTVEEVGVLSVRLAVRQAPGPVGTLVKLPACSLDWSAGESSALRETLLSTQRLGYVGGLLDSANLRVCVSRLNGAMGSHALEDGSNGMVYWISVPVHVLPFCTPSPAWPRSRFVVQLSEVKENNTATGDSTTSTAAMGASIPTTCTAGSEKGQQQVPAAASKTGGRLHVPAAVGSPVPPLHNALAPPTVPASSSPSSTHGCESDEDVSATTTTATSSSSRYEDEDSVRSTDSKSNEHARDPLGALNVLVVDDTLLNREIASMMLERLGHTVTVANDGQQAVDVVMQNTPDIILMDIQMPVMDGLTAAQKLRQMGHTMPILAWSAGAIPTDVMRARDVGMQGYYPKPLSLPRMRRALPVHVANPSDWLEVK